MNWIAVVLPWLVADDPIAIGETLLPPGSKVTIESRLDWEHSIRPDPEGELLQIRMEAEIDCVATMQPAPKGKRTRALVRFEKAASKTRGGDETFDQVLPIQGRNYVLFGSEDEVDVVRAEGMDSPLPDLESDEVSEVRIYTDPITFGSPLKPALRGAALEKGKAVELDLEEAGPLFEPCNQGARMERCTLEFVERRKLDAHECVVFKVAMRSVDEPPPDTTFEVLVEFQGELIVTLAHGFPLSCRLRGTTIARPRAADVPMSEAPEGPGSREWTWTAKIE